MAKDKEYNKLIHKNKWLKLRKAKLSSNPICERCKEKPATEVHHIKPVEDGIGAERYRLMYDPHNLMALCLCLQEVFLDRPVIVSVVCCKAADCAYFLDSGMEYAVRRVIVQCNSKRQLDSPQRIGQQAHHLCRLSGWHQLPCRYRSRQIRFERKSCLCYTIPANQSLCQQLILHGNQFHNNSGSKKQN